MTDQDQLDALAEAAESVRRSGATSFYVDPDTILELIAAIRERDELREAARLFLEFHPCGIPMPGQVVCEEEQRLRAALHREDGA